MPVGKRRRVGEHPVVSAALSRCRETSLFVQQFQRQTVKTARLQVRGTGNKGWYSMKKTNLVCTVVLDIFVKRIQRFVRTRGGNVRKRRAILSGFEGDACSITLTPIADLPVRNRYCSSNHWFDRESLVRYLKTSCDFVHPVTREPFTLEDVQRIDTGLVPIFENRRALRSGLVNRMENIQCVENELEDIFKEMIDVACSTSSRREFNLTMSYSEVQFEECFKDLVHLDRGRCMMALKSLPALIRRDEYTTAYLSRKRDKELKELVREFIYRLESC
jgi:hypothetical protein